MNIFHPEYIVDSNQTPKSVVLPINEWREILSAIEELEDIKAYDEAKLTSDEIIPFDQALNEIDTDVSS